MGGNDEGVTVVGGRAGVNGWEMSRDGWVVRQMDEVWRGDGRTLLEDG